nr:hypothetical protein [Phaeodactylibacter xiamenensis]
MEVFFFCLLKSDFASQLSGGHLVFFQHEEEFVLEEKNESQAEKNDSVDVALNPKKVGNGLGDCVGEEGKNTDGHPKGGTQSSLLPTGF